MADLDGQNRVVVVQEPDTEDDTAHYFGLAVDANYIYLSDWASK